MKNEKIAFRWQRASFQQMRFISDRYDVSKNASPRREKYITTSGPTDIENDKMKTCQRLS
jgi:hypothetical protein